MSKLKFRNCLEQPADYMYIVNENNKVGIYYKGYVYRFFYTVETPAPFPKREHIIDWCTYWLPLNELCQDREKEYERITQEIECGEA